MLLEMMRPLQEDTLIQDVEVLIEKGVSLPDWLDGTPILVDMSTKQAMKGTEAVNFINFYMEQQTRAHEERTQNSNQRESIPSMEEMTGVLANGERLLHETSNFDPAPPDADTMNLTNRDEKITDADLERYMEMRNKNQPPPPPENA